MHGEKVIQSNRYAVETKNGNFDLVITGVVEEDRGIYVCQINSEPMQNIVSCCCCPYQSLFLLSVFKHCALFLSFISIFVVFKGYPLTNNWVGVGG